MTENEYTGIKIAIKNAYEDAYLNGFEAGWDLAATQTLPNVENVAQDAREAAEMYIKDINENLLNGMFKDRIN